MAAGFAERERAGALNFARMAKREGVKRVVYLGGLGDESESKHLRSRHETARVLAAEGPPLTYFRAAMVVGAGSESYRTLRYLVGRLPVMIAPSWLRTATQPIGIDATVEYLRRAPEVPESEGREVQIGGPDVLSYSEMLDRMALAMGKRAAPQAPGPLHHAVALGALARPGHAGRHQGGAPARRGADDGDRRHRPVGRRAVRNRAGVVRRGAAASPGGGTTRPGRRCLTGQLASMIAGVSDQVEIAAGKGDVEDALLLEREHWIDGPPHELFKQDARRVPGPLDLEGHGAAAGQGLLVGDPRR